MSLLSSYRFHFTNYLFSQSVFIYVFIYFYYLDLLDFHGVQINEPASFAVELGKARGPLDARVVAPSGAEEQAIVQEIDEGIKLLLNSAC